MNGSPVIAGALLAQVCLALILFIGASIVDGSRKATDWHRFSSYSYNYLMWEFFAVVLLTLSALAFTPEMSQAWLPLFKGTSFEGLPSAWVLLLVFVADILLITRLVYLTGGSISSPFQPAWFLIPTLALLLRESNIRVISYSLLVSFGFCVLMYKYQRLPESYLPRSRIAYGFVTVSCLMLACAIGILTRDALE